MDKIIVTTYDELKIILTEIMEGNYPSKREESVFPERLSVSEALAFLKESGFQTSKSKIYQLTSKNMMPFGKFGNKLIFSRTELYEWANKQIIRTSHNSDCVVEMIKNAQRKNR